MHCLGQGGPGCWRSDWTLAVSLLSISSLSISSVSISRVSLFSVSTVSISTISISSVCELQLLCCISWSFLLVGSPERVMYKCKLAF